MGIAGSAESKILVYFHFPVKMVDPVICVTIA